MGWSVSFVYLPEYYRYGQSGKDYYSYHDQVIEVVRSSDIPVVDISEEFNRHEDPLSFFPFKRFGHY